MDPLPDKPRTILIYTPLAGGAIFEDMAFQAHRLDTDAAGPWKVPKWYVTLESASALGAMASYLNPYIFVYAGQDDPLLLELYAMAKQAAYRVVVCTTTHVWLYGFNLIDQFNLAPQDVAALLDAPLGENAKKPGERGRMTDAT